MTSSDHDDVYNLQSIPNQHTKLSNDKNLQNGYVISLCNIKWY